MTINWSQDAEIVITTALDEIPEVGSLLSGLVSLFWPESKEDVWAEIKAATEKLIKQAISKDDFDRVRAVLGSAEQGSGLIGVLANFLGAVNKTNGQDVQQTWTAANTSFIGGSGVFEQTGIEILLLPLFAQMANLHITLLRDGVLKSFCAASELQGRIKLYTAWADKWSAKAISDRSSQTPNQFNPINEVTRFMQINVLNFSQLWPYFDTTIYPKPVKNLPLGPEIFYTITEFAPSGWSLRNHDYAPPGTRAGSVTGVGIYSVASDEGNWVMLGGSTVTYSSGQSSGYTGVPINGGTPPVNQYIYDVGTYSLTSTTTTEDNPIVQVAGNYCADPYIRYIQFTFKNSSHTTDIPSNIDNNSDSNFSFTIAPPAGYFLSSVWMPSKTNFYTGAFDTVFGFQNHGGAKN